MLFNKIVIWLVGRIVKSPFYPHWLNDLKASQGNNSVLNRIQGSVIEVGAGDGRKKHLLCFQYPAIKKYVATDFSSWDNEFNKIDQKIQTSYVQSVISGFEKRNTIDVVCDATKLPFHGSSFDYHLGFEVLEHISDPVKYMKEAVRVLKPGGRIILSVPYMYRMHGKEPEHKWDYYRYSLGFFHEVCKQFNIKLEKVVCNTGMGTTVASMINQWLIRQIAERQFLAKWISVLVAVICFPICNCMGYVIDLKPDIRFATRIHVVMKKKSK